MLASGAHSIGFRSVVKSRPLHGPAIAGSRCVVVRSKGRATDRTNGGRSSRAIGARCPADPADPAGTRRPRRPRRPRRRAGAALAVGSPGRRPRGCGRRAATRRGTGARSGRRQGRAICPHIISSRPADRAVNVTRLAPRVWPSRRGSRRFAPGLRRASDES